MVQGVSLFPEPPGRSLLSGGYAAEVKQALQRPVYYLTHDIAARLQLKAAPSVVVEQDNKLTVREVRLATQR